MAAMRRILAFLFLPLHSLLAAWSAEEIAPIAAPAKIQFSRIKLNNGDRTVVVHAVTFLEKDCLFAMMDDPEAKYDLASAAAKRGALAAVNGGYFHPNRTPLGLRVRQGSQLHRLEKAKLLSGLMTVADGKISLLRIAEFTKSATADEAVQAGPFLVDRGRPVAALDAHRFAARTVIVAGPNRQFGLVIVDRATLADTGAMLAMPNIFGKWNVVRALNLDGGSSTGLWVAGPEPFYRREWRDVRDFVAIVPR
jgi:exopolysaccharide biosynthesis protein